MISIALSFKVRETNGVNIDYRPISRGRTNISSINKWGKLNNEENKEEKNIFVELRCIASSVETWVEFIQSL